MDTWQQNCFKKSNLEQKLKYPILKKNQIMFKLKKSDLNPKTKTSPSIRS